MRRRVVVTAGLAAAVFLSGCATTHVATTIARDGIGTAGSNPSPTGSPSPTTPSTAAPPTPAPITNRPTDQDFGAISRLMRARAAAVVAGDEDAFIATVDGRRPAFVSAQRIVFENLQDLPVTSMSYEVEGLGLSSHPGIAVMAATSAVDEHVFFSGTDRHPMSSEVNDTFVKRAGHWRLAIEETDPDIVGESVARPWAGPRIEVVVRGHLVVVADASFPGRAASVADTVEDGLEFDAGILDVATDDHLMVDATSSGSVSTFNNGESAGAVTFPVYATHDFEVTGVAGMRVKLNPQYITELLTDPGLLRHELTHYLMFQYTSVNPTWLTEGLAEYVSHQPAGLSTEYMTTETYDRLMKRRQELTVAGLFGLDPETDYPLAMACVTFLVEHGGVGRLKDLMSAYAERTDAIYGDEYTGRLLRRVYDLSPAEVAHGAFDLLDALR